MSLEMEQSKKHKRTESKKRKAIALLTLIKEREKEEEELESLMYEKGTESDSSSDSDGVTPHKQRKVSVTCGVTNNVNNTDSNKTKPEPTNCRPEEASQNLRMKLREKQRASMQKPKLYLTLDELLKETKQSDQDESNEKLPPLFMQDLQNLLLVGVMGNLASIKPRWCRLLRMAKVASVVVMVINELCVSDLEEHAENFQFIKENFFMFVELVSPHQYDSTVDQDIFRVPLSRRSEIKNISQKNSGKRKDKEKFDRRCLLLNPSQLISEGYPLPVKTEQENYKDFVFSKAVYTEPHSQSPMFAIDCEMCYTTAKKNELTRVSVVNEKLEVVYESYVKPYNPILNYLTKYSGITKDILSPITVRLEDVQSDLQRLLPSDAIWCGQSLCYDLKALKMFHPFVIDTSFIYNLTGVRSKKTGLKRLTQLFLHRNIQNSELGHCSQEDSKATMELVLLKLKNGLTFGDCILESFEDKPRILNHSEKSDVPDDKLESKLESADVTIVCKNQMHLCSSDCKIKPENSENMNKKTIEQKRNVFLQEKRYSTFFKQVEKVKKTAAVIDCKEVICRCVPNIQKDEPVKFVEISSDKSCYKEAKKYVTDTSFVWSQFHCFSQIQHDSPELTDLKRQNVMKIDRYIKKLMKKIKLNSLVCVLLTGRNEQHRLCNGGAFIKIT